MPVRHILEALHLPTPEELRQPSVVLGRFEYPPAAAYADEAEWADICAELDNEIRLAVEYTLTEIGYPVQEWEIRLSEMFPGEIRLYP